MNYNESFLNEKKDNLHNRILVYEFNNDVNVEELNNMIPTKENINESNFNYVFKGWYLSENFEESSKLTAEKIKKLQDDGIHYFSVYAKWEKYPQIKLSIRDIGDLERFASFKFKNEEMRFGKEVRITENFSEVEKILPKVNDLIQSETLYAKKAIFTGDNANVKIDGFYLDEEYTQIFNRESFNKFVENCKNGNNNSLIYNNNYNLNLYLKMGYVRNSLNIKLNIEEVYAADVNPKLEETYIKNHNLNENLEVNFKNYSYSEILKFIPKSSDITCPIFNYGTDKQRKYKFNGWKIAENKYYSSYQNPDYKDFNQKNWDSLISNVGVGDVLLTPIWDQDTGSNVLLFNVDSSICEFNSCPINNFLIYDSKIIEDYLNFNFTEDIQKIIDGNGLVIKDNSYKFSGWFLDTKFEKEFNKANLKSEIENGNNYILIYANFEKVNN